VRFVSASFGYFVPYALPIADREITVNVVVYDETFFCDIGYAETAPLLFPASDTFSPHFSHAPLFCTGTGPRPRRARE